MSLVTIGAFSKPEVAHLVRMRLVAGGVPAFVLDENMVQMDWLYSNAIWGVRLQIEEEDGERAREILKDAGDILLLDRPVCPTCASIQTAPDETPDVCLFLSLALVGFLYFCPSSLEMRDCGQIWNEKTGYHE